MATKLRFARNFLRSLSKIKAHRPIISQSLTDLRKRSMRIKIAAYSSMARAVGPRRAWARALLFKLRRRQVKRPVRSRCGRVKAGESSSSEQVGRLRGLVPGGEAMDDCTLLEETADYIHCLMTQVKVMKAISQLSN